MEDGITVLECNDATYLRHAVREYVRKNKIKTDTLYNMSFVFKVDEQNTVVIKDIKNEELVNKILEKESQIEKESLFDENNRLKIALEYDKVMEENDRLNTTDKVVKVKDDVVRDLNKHYNKWIST